MEIDALEERDVADIAPPVEVVDEQDVNVVVPEMERDALEVSET